jgi:STE24 endopeptidase
MLWFAWPGRLSDASDVSVLRTAAFLGFYLALVIVLGLWSRSLAGRVTSSNLRRSVRWFNRIMAAARTIVPVWFGFGVFMLDWGHVIRSALGPARDWPLELPGAVLAILPALGAWVGLWWAQFPADRALREQSLLIQIDDGAPVHAPPTLGVYIRSNLRMQILFTAVPILLILLVHDVVFGTLWHLKIVGPEDQAVQAMASLGAAMVVFLLAPEILRRVLHTDPLPDSPLRRRLEQMCQRHGLRYRQILLWRTGQTMGNAAVMGIVPWFRYILLSDLLLESMTDQQIEAVFAHELGHIVHRHMGWYLVFFTALLLLAAGPGEWAGLHLLSARLPEWLPMDLAMTLAGLAAFVLSFGYVSRRFERQADVFAARTMVNAEGETAGSAVEAQGAHALASALHRVALINNMPVRARSWCHGSIARRMDYVRQLAVDPVHTRRFDRFMVRLNVGLLAAVAAGAAWLLVQGLGGA